MGEFEKKYHFSKEEWQSCLKVLEVLKENPLNNPDNQTFGTLITKVHKKAKKVLKNIIQNIDTTNINEKKLQKNIEKAFKQKVIKNNKNLI